MERPPCLTNQGAMTGQHTVSAQPCTRGRVRWGGTGTGQGIRVRKEVTGGESVTKNECRLCGGKQRISHLTGDVDPNEQGPESQGRGSSHYSMSDREPPKAFEQRCDVTGDVL